jgi:CHAT domain-containing protein/Tfp pilus assembly protein PilF
MKKGGFPAFSLLPLIILFGAGSKAGSAVEIENQSPAVVIESARTAKNAGEYERAAGILREVLRNSKQNGRPDIEATCLLNLGITLWDLGEMQEAADAFAQAIPLFERAGDARSGEICAKGMEIARNYGLAKESRTANRLKESLELFDKAIALGRSIGIIDFELKCLRQKSLTYWQLGDFEKFHYCNERGLEIAKKINHRKEVARCLNNIGAYYIKVSDFTNGLRICRIALPMVQTANELSEEAICLNNLAVIYKQLGEFDLAIRNMKRVLELDLQLGDRLQVSKSKASLGGLLLRRGYVYRNMQDVHSGRIELEESLSVHGLDQIPDLKIAALSNLGYAHLLLKQYDLAIQLFEKAMKDISFDQPQEEYGHILNNIGNAYLNKGRIEKAEERFSKASEVFITSSFQEVLWEAFYGLGCCNEAKGDLKAALAFFKKSMEAMERVRRQISLDIFKMGFAHNKMVVYDRAMDILYTLYRSAPSDARLDELYQMMERAKAQAFLESLIATGYRDDSEKKPATMDFERMLSKEISDLNMKVTSSGASDADRKAWLYELENKEKEYMRIMSDINTRKRPPASFQLPKNLALSEVQAHLVNERSAILEYFIGEKRSYAMLIAPHYAKLYSLRGRTELEASLKGYLKFLSTPFGGQFDGNRAAERIARELLVPLQGGNDLGITTLIVVPDGILNYLPFETLRVPDGNSHSFLLERYRISYVPSVSTLQFFSRRQGSLSWSKDFLAFGAPVRPGAGHPMDSANEFGEDLLRGLYFDRDVALTPLPFSKTEIKKAEKLFPADKKDVYLGDQASEAVLKRTTLSKYRILHFACHAILDDNVPLRSSLVLSPGVEGDEDGFLQVREIYNLRMDAELVVLSACQSGNGSLEQGEGLVGLTRGFFQAGAHSIVSSLWAINDRSTADFIEDFYTALARGEDKSSALRAAKLRVLKSSRAHPFYWAAFILSGDPAPVWQGGHQTKMPN